MGHGSDFRWLGRLGVAAVAALGSCGPSSQAPNAPAPTGDGPRSAPRPEDQAEPLRVLVYTRTAGFRHDSIEAGVEAMKRLGIEHGWEVDATEDAARFNDGDLRGVDVIVFLSTTGDVLNGEQQGAMERVIGSGAGFVGIHAAADTEYDWPWYGELVGAYFKGHPAVQEADVVIPRSDHPSTRHLPSMWTRTDEWYDYRTQPGEALAARSPGGTPDAPTPPRITVLAQLMETSYEGGTMGQAHPIAWCHEFGGGRSWYTGGGHTIESFDEPAFLKHIAGGILWAGGRE